MKSRRYAQLLLFIAMASSSEGLSSTTATATGTKNILFDVPVSNHGGRVRIILYKKGIPESECKILSPTKLGGFKSEEYLKINPQGKVPSLKCLDTGRSIAESDTVCRYLLHRYAHVGPSFQPDDPLSNEIARFHDVYLATIQSCLYRPAPPFGNFGTRKDALREYSKQLFVIADLIDGLAGPYLCGDQVSLADATLFPSVVFASHMFPKFMGNPGLFDDGDDVNNNRPPIPSKIEDWFQRMIDTDSAFQKVYEEVGIDFFEGIPMMRWRPWGCDVLLLVRFLTRSVSESSPLKTQ
jgi:glutathione S-transferase